MVGSEDIIVPVMGDGGSAGGLPGGGDGSPPAENENGTNVKLVVSVFLEIR